MAVRLRAYAVHMAEDLSRNPHEAACLATDRPEKIKAKRAARPAGAKAKTKTKAKAQPEAKAKTETPAQTVRRAFTDSILALGKVTDSERADLLAFMRSELDKIDA